MPLRSGNWKATVNGTEAELNIEMPNQQGVFAGQLLGIALRGFWDEVSQTIAFGLVAVVDDGIPIVASFQGHLFRSPPDPEPGRDVIATLTGSVQMSAHSLFVTGTTLFPALGTARRKLFGWFAQIPEIQ